MPSLVLHRRGDRTVPIARGRELASLLPNARFVALSGDSHLPHFDDQREVQRALAGFLDDAVPAEASETRHLTRRETEVLRLVAAGLSNREIATSLVLQRAHRPPTRREYTSRAPPVVASSGRGARDARRPLSSRWQPHLPHCPEVEIDERPTSRPLILSRYDLISIRRR